MQVLDCGDVGGLNSAEFQSAVRSLVCCVCALVRVPERAACVGHGVCARVCLCVRLSQTASVCVCVLYFVLSFVRTRACVNVSV